MLPRLLRRVVALQATAALQQTARGMASSMAPPSSLRPPRLPASAAGDASRRAPYPGPGGAAGSRPSFPRKDGVPRGEANRVSPRARTHAGVAGKSRMQAAAGGPKTEQRAFRRKEQVASILPITRALHIGRVYVVSSSFCLRFFLCVKAALTQPAARV